MGAGLSGSFPYSQYLGISSSLLYASLLTHSSKWCFLGITTFTLLMNTCPPDMGIGNLGICFHLSLISATFELCLQFPSK